MRLRFLRRRDRLLQIPEQILHVFNPHRDAHQQLNDEQQLAAGVSKDLVRISVGIEDVEDLLWDLEQAIAASQEA